jgi:toxin HigB-1
VIISFAHKGLQKFWETDSAAGIQAKHARRLHVLLTVIDSASTLQDLASPTFRLHPLKGNKKGFWSMTVNGNWRIVFRFENGDAYVVDYDDYH